jgi:glycosyltransferase involved in cell wall biosynthesis
VKVAIVTPEFMPNWGGIGTYVAQLAKHLPAEFEVHVITLSRADPGRGPSGTSTIDGRITLHPLGTASDFFLYNNQFQANLFRRFKALQEENRFDLIHANHAQMPDLLLRILDGHLPTVTTVHTTIGSQRFGTKRSEMALRETERSEKMTYLLLPFLLAMERIYFQRPTNTIFVSAFIKSFYERRYRAAYDSPIIHNGVDTSTFRPRAGSECLQHFPQLHGRENIILYSGRMIALKGLDTAIRAFAQVQKETKATMVFAGTGKTECWRRLLLAAGVPESSFIFLNPVPYQEMPYLYPLADLFILPSYSESFPMTVLEAMASGTPLVASDVGGIPEMVRNGTDGELVTPGDASALEQSMVRLLTDRRSARGMAMRARSRVEDQFTSQMMALKTAQVYRKAVEDAK